MHRFETTAACRQAREAIGAALQNLPSFRTCALLDYPDHLNAGDHLIWLGTVLYLTVERGLDILYTSSLADFSPAELERAAGDSPIFLQGGGNLGDLWPDSQRFRERIISTYADRPVVILPQTIHFSTDASLRQAMKIFNAHPDLTIFARDHHSYELGSKYFEKCRVILAPDMAFFLEQVPLPSYAPSGKREIKYLCRSDAELDQDFSAERLGLTNIVEENWSTYSWAYAGRGKLRDYGEWYWQIPGAIDFFRESWQRGLSRPGQLLSWRRFLEIAPYTTKLSSPSIKKYSNFSWKIFHDSICQLLRSRLLISNRLHGHVLASMLGLPNILLPGSYHKNQSFYESWSTGSQISSFVSEPDRVKQEAERLLSKAY